MLFEQLSAERIKNYFSTDVFHRGMTYFEDETVENINVQHNNHYIEIAAIVKGSKKYKVVVYFQKKHDALTMRADCSCPFDSYCKHIVAAILQAKHVTASKKTPDQSNAADLAAHQWLQSLEKTLGVVSEPEKIDTTYGLYFLVSISKKWVCFVEPVLLRQLKSGKLGAQKRMHYYHAGYKNHFKDAESLLMNQLKVMGEGAHGGYYHAEAAPLSRQFGQRLLVDLLATGKCLLNKEDATPITLGDSLPLSLSWELSPEGTQTLTFNIAVNNPLFFFIDGPWYFDKTNRIMGPVQTELRQEVLQQLMNAPQIPAAYAAKLNHFTQHQPHLSALPKPKMVQPKDVELCRPTPHLRLMMQAIKSSDPYRRTVASEMQPVAVLTFQYQDTRISWHDESPIVKQMQQETLLQFARDFEVESDAIKQLQQHHALIPIQRIQLWCDYNDKIGHYFCFIQVNPLEFYNSALPQLRELNWIIQVDDDYPFRLIDSEADEIEWFADINEEAGSDWFNLELGITVGEEKINLLPVINQLLAQLNGVSEVAQLKEKTYFAPLPNGQFIALPGERVQQMVSALIELFDQQSLDENQQLRLSKTQAARLIEIEQASGAAALRWHGGERLRELAKKISEFKMIQPSPIPTTFQGTLRPYQHQGLSWLQFLREYELAGVLADDMGLGKTIQALAHIMLEKESGRMTKPTLVIAPTSLMYNWEKEAKQFAPQLKCCVLYGADRNKFFEQLADYDLILTTYPLILRDKTILLKQQFHLLILDEAQCIKNHKALATQIVIQLQAKHRLCLTGTPMENHLGELWSLYHFLMPGLLGEQTYFKRSFRTPIEKHNDIERRQLLNRRVAPFLMRRTKDAVAKELPAKTEIIQYVELDGGQRDLYETIRVAMEEKVKKEVEKLGLSRSHIIILDALLKLRQVCCDPRLLKMESVKSRTTESAKMTHLASMLPELIEEGRRILLFSQFTEMLALIEQLIISLNISYVKLTGQTKDRKTPIEAFQSGQVSLFLISLKAGGTGLNLTAADTVIHFDPWWNPAVENQATDRAHRIGQDKPVFVYKIVTKSTVEEKIIAMQAKKKTLADSIYTEKSTGESSITGEDLKDLLTAF
ncbi:MAG: DEAD/DEAH box helicase [Gammaproteobacteria bacterium]|nr:DEAD/DEAH box helicase [Gammaproteobacteria bacterium]